jgi:hypothetical protein
LKKASIIKSNACWQQPETIALRRSRIGGLKLDALGLAEGEWCYLEEMQLARLAPV